MSVSRDSFKSWIAYFLTWGLALAVLFIVILYIVYIRIFVGQGISFFSSEGLHLFVMWFSAVSNAGLDTYVAVIAAFGVFLIAVQVAYSAVQVRGSQKKAVIREFKEKSRYRTILIFSTIGLTVYSLMIIFDFFIDVYSTWQQYENTIQQDHIRNGYDLAEEINKTFSNIDIWKLLFPILFMLAIIWYIATVIDGYSADEERIMAQEKEHDLIQRIDNARDFVGSINFSGLEKEHIPASDIPVQDLKPATSLHDEQDNKRGTSILFKNLVSTMAIFLVFNVLFTWADMSVNFNVGFSIFMWAAFYLLLALSHSSKYYKDKASEVLYRLLLVLLGGAIVLMVISIFLEWGVWAGLIGVLYIIVILCCMYYFSRQAKTGSNINTWVPGSWILWHRRKNALRHAAQLEEVLTEEREEAQKAIQDSRSSDAVSTDGNKNETA